MIDNPIQIYDTMTRSKRRFEPHNPQQVTMYVCGPTVYGDPHIGNIRSFTRGDLVRRWLECWGYHAKKGTLEGVMSHTYSGGNIESLHVNGVEVGETGLNARIAAHHGVPLAFLAGDVATTMEALEVDTGIVTVTVKDAIGRMSAKCLHPEVAREEIRKGAANAARLKLKPMKVKTPVELLIRFTDARRADSAALIPTTERVDGKTIRLVAPDMVMQQSLRSSWSLLAVRNSNLFKSKARV